MMKDKYCRNTLCALSLISTRGVSHSSFMEFKSKRIYYLYFA